MELSLREKELAIEIGFDKKVLLIVKEESHAEIQRLHLETECYEEDIDIALPSQVRTFLQFPLAYYHVITGIN